MAKSKAAAKKSTTTKKGKCGIVMPIAAFNDYTADHWKDVKEIIVEAAETAGFDANIVSYANESTVIHKTIIQNLYDNEIVVVDVSGKNPNVMFELGMRLAFDKPTIVIKDDLTNYSFDTSPIDHLGYPATLHYQSINSFKDLLRNKIDATYQSSKSPKYSSFLKNFGEFTISKLGKKPISETQYLLKAVQDLQAEINSQKRTNSNTSITKETLYRGQMIYDYWRVYMQSKGQHITTKIMASDFYGFKKFMRIEYPSRYQSLQIDILKAVEVANIILQFDRDFLIEEE